ncbi:MAG: SlyX family protein [Treponema sp.]|jgi:SlyX protein|nr:SlyX family protein [Treponema sp.]
MEQEERLQKIETKLAYLEDFLNRLQDDAVERNSRLDSLFTEHRAIKSKILQISEDLEEYPDRRPPHY